MGSSETITLRICCRTLPPTQRDGVATEFGLQNAARELDHGALGDDGLLRFTFVAKAAPAENGTRLTGPFVHGKPGDRFLYLGWRPHNGPVNGWIRRWKISLGAIIGDLIASVNDGEGLELVIDDASARKVWLEGDGWTRFSLAGE